MRTPDNSEDSLLQFSKRTTRNKKGKKEGGKFLLSPAFFPLVPIRLEEGT